MAISRVTLGGHRLRGRPPAFISPGGGFSTFNLPRKAPTARGNGILLTNGSKIAPNSPLNHPFAILQCIDRAEAWVRPSAPRPASRRTTHSLIGWRRRWGRMWEGVGEAGGEATRRNPQSDFQSLQRKPSELGPRCLRPGTLLQSAHAAVSSLWRRINYSSGQLPMIIYESCIKSDFCLKFDYLS